VGSCGWDGGARGELGDVMSERLGSLGCLIHGFGERGLRRELKIEGNINGTRKIDILV
jgi:hypothetical protein